MFDESMHKGFIFLKLYKTKQQTFNYELGAFKQNEIKWFMPNKTWIAA